MRRRLSLSLSALAWPLRWPIPALLAHCAALAHDTPGAARIGWLSTLPPLPEHWALLLDGLRERGWIEGRNLSFERLYSQGDQSQLRPLAQELVHRRVSLIIASGTEAAAAAKLASAMTPIVFFYVGDALSTGLVDDLARPGGNATGFGGFGADVHGKQVQLLMELKPQATRLGLLFNPDFPMHAAFLLEVEAAAKKLGARLVRVPLRADSEIDSAFASVASEGVHGVLILTQPKIHEHGPRVAQAALRHRLPAITGFDNFARAGILMSYGARLEDDMRRVPHYVDRILRGTSPSQLPVERPARFYLTLNARTARALGLTIPRPLLLRADEVIT